jgi:glycerate kinase
MQLSVMIAPDSFKGSLSATVAAQAIAEGWSMARPYDSLRLIPQADGGEGTLDIVQAAVPGSVRRDAGFVTGPDGRPVHGEWLELPDGIAVIELAQMCGLPLMKTPNPMGATTFGLGQVIRSALAAGATQLVIGVGGSATTDGGAGALAALGLVALGGELRADQLARITAVDQSTLLRPPAGGVVVLTDVSNPLLGPNGAAAVFGPQKGATAEDVARLDSALAHFSTLLGGDPELAGCGAAGGTAYGLAAAWNANIEPGAKYLSSLSGLSAALESADVLITGEGRFDTTSLSGKIVGQLITLAGAHDVRIGVIAGHLDLPPATRDGRRLWSISLEDLAGSAAEAMADPERWLREAGERAGRALG